MTLRKALMAATILALPVAAKAQPLTGLYVGGGAGINSLQAERSESRPFGLPGYTPDKLYSRIGPAVALSVGYGFGNGFRAEVEGDYRYNTLNGALTGGTEQKYGPMVNVLYDFGNFVPIVHPYIGLGAGYMFTTENNLHTGGPTATYDAARSTQGSFAYQGIVGIAVPVGMPNLQLTLDYRYLGLLGNRDYDATAVVNGTVHPGVVRSTDNYNSSVLIGFRYAFGSPPPPAPAPAPAAVAPAPISRSYLVFFDWDKSTLTDRARQIVSEAAANSTKVQYTQIQVNGYTDTSGTARYNMGLSVRRAQAVAAELVKDGVPQAAIAIQGFGETHLLVPTGPGVREPQNRRVEIIIK